MAGFFDTLFGGGAEREAAEKNRALYGDYQTKGADFLKDTYGTGRTDLGNAVGAYDPVSSLATGYNKGGALYLDALGVNGPEGNARASGAFQTSPGYQQGIDAGIDVLNRRRATQGMGQSGNADIDALTFGQNQQNQQYNTWLSNLASTGNAGIGLTGTAAQGRAGGFTNLANLASQYGQNQTNLLGSSTSGMANANNTQAAGEAAGAKNALGAALSVASMATAGGTGGFGNSLLGSFMKPAG